MRVCAGGGVFDGVGLCTENGLVQSLPAMADPVMQCSSHRHVPLSMLVLPAAGVHWLAFCMHRPSGG